jgi:hypothetical protein
MLNGCHRNEQVSQANGPFGALGAVPIDRRPKALTEMYGDEI